MGGGGGGGWCTYDYSASLSPNLWIMTFDLDLDLDLGLTIGKSSQILQYCQLSDQIRLHFNISSKNKMFFSVKVVLK